MGQIFLYIFFTACFVAGALIKQYTLLPEQPFVAPLLAAISFCGAIGLLGDYTWRIRHSLWALVPALLIAEIMGSLVSKAGFSGLAYYIYIPGALVFLAYGLLCLRSGVGLLKSDRGLALKFVVLGVLTLPILAWEFITLYPDEYNYYHIGWRILYLAVFLWLLVIDFTTDFSRRPAIMIERQILRLSLLVVAAMYFERFVFK
ncbi:MAG: hypothetical protein AAF998_14155 [Bacteroidota bacterium]